MRYLLLTFLMTALFAESDKPFHSTRDRDYDVHHIRIELSVHVWEKRIEGHVVHTLSPLNASLSRLAFDFGGGDIQSVILNHTDPLPFNLDGNRLGIELDRDYGWDDTLTLSIAYNAKPKRGLYFILPDSVYPNKHVQAWTQGEDMDNHYWVPIYDYPNDKASFECILTVDAPFVAISNGELVSVKDHGDSRTFHWRENYPMVSYLISFAVGNYVKYEDRYNEIPIGYWVYPEHTREDALRSFGRTPDMMRFFGQVTGVEYPYEKYDQVIIEDFMYGGMENVTLTHQTDRTMHTDRARPDHTSDGLVAHELAHQWYGDLLTTRNWANAWLNEGFATYFAGVWQEHDKGYDDAEYSRYRQVRSVMRADARARRPVVQYHYHDSMELFDANVYAKGRVILNMLQNYLGEDAFWKAIRDYTRTHAFKNVETSDLKNAIEGVTGQNLYWFFDQWLYKGGLPEIEVESKYSHMNRMVTLTIRQNQDVASTSLFRLPVTVLIDDGDIKRYDVFIEQKETTFTFPSRKAPRMVVFDEGFQIPKFMDYPKKEKELIYQLKNAPHVVDRVWAAKEMGKRRPRRSVTAALVEAIRSDPFWGVRLEAAKAYGRIKDKKAAQTLIHLARGEKDTRVKRALIRAMGNLGGEFARLYLVKTIRTSNKDYVMADAIRALARVDSSAGDSSGLQEIIEMSLQADSHGETIRRAAVFALGTVKSEDHYRQLFDLADYGGSPHEARAAALEQLSNYEDSHPEVLDQIADYLLDPSRAVRRKCIDLLARHGNRSHHDALDELAERDPLDATRVKRAKRRMAERMELEKRMSGSLEKEVKRLTRTLDRIRAALEDYEKTPPP